MFCSVIQGSFPASSSDFASVSRVRLPQASAGRAVNTRPETPLASTRVTQAKTSLVQMRGAQHAATVQRHANGAAFQLPPNLASFGRSGGQRLPEPVRQQMESALSADFSDVRVHVGPEAQSIGAIAFTHGSSIYFAPGQYDPHTLRGQQLLGHELTHVVQQRAGRVRNPFGSGVAVVQDHVLEAEADRMGQRAAAHRVEVQAKMAASSGRGADSVRMSSPVHTGAGSFRVAAGADGREVGSVMVHARDRAAIEITNLAVDPAHRERGIGKMLMASAMQTGLKLGKSKVTLAAQDNGSGRLTHWYKQMGFSQVGVNQRGYSQLEASIGRALSGVAQTAVDPRRSQNRQSGSASTGVSCSPSFPLPPVANRSRAGVIQRMDAPVDADEDICERFIEARHAQGRTSDEKPTWPELAKISFGTTDLDKELKRRGIKAIARFQQIVRDSKAYAKVRLAEQAGKDKERLRSAELNERRLVDVAFRRMETIARFLETDSNVCVAIAEVGGVIYATTNKDVIGPIGYAEDTLFVNRHLNLAKEEPLLATSASKLSTYIGASPTLQGSVNNIKQVGSDWSDSLHAEMKMLDYLYVIVGIRGSVTIYISRLCCPKCRKALAKWNEAKKNLMVVVRTGTHGSAYPGWQPPSCIESDDELSTAIAGSHRARWRHYSSQTGLNILTNRRERSPSPPPKGGKFKTTL